MHSKILLLAVAALAALVAASAQEGPACESSCWNVNITFPFGSGEGCYYSSDFLVTCNQSSGELFFGRNTSDIVISNMSTSKSELEIMMLVGHDCYNSSAPVRKNMPSLTHLENLTGFWVSTKNKFVVIGCDTIAYFAGRRGNETDGTGCVSTCGRNSLLTNGSCSGVGCCELAVPEGLRSFRLAVGSLNDRKNVTDFNPCGYGFLIEEGKYSFSTTHLANFESVKMPMLVDWAIGNLTCDEAKDADDFLCRGKSECDQDYKGPGYRCRCREGYDCNPYANDCKSKFNFTFGWILYFTCFHLMK